MKNFAHMLLPLCTVHVCPYKGQTGQFHWQEHDNSDLTHLENNFWW